MLHRYSDAINHGDRNRYRFVDVEAPLQEQAEAMVAARSSKSRHHLRGAGTWTAKDEAAFRNSLAELHGARAHLLRDASDPSPVAIDEDKLRAAVENNNIHLAYQPIVDVAEGRVVAVEALARWRTEDGRETPAGDFIALAEASDLVHSISCSAIRTVRVDLVNWLREHPQFKVTINIVGDDLRNDAFHDSLANEIEGFGILPTQIAFELTERRPVDSAEMIVAMNGLRARGYSFYIDDFGCGYSNISYLCDLTIDAIKIDRSFTSEIGLDSKRGRLFELIADMAKALEIAVIVEGVENAAQAEFCHVKNLTLLQGWYLSRPMTPTALKKHLRHSY